MAVTPDHVGVRGKTAGRKNNGGRVKPLDPLRPARGNTGYRASGPQELHHAGIQAHLHPKRPRPAVQRPDIFVAAPGRVRREPAGKV